MFWSLYNQRVMSQSEELLQEIASDRRSGASALTLRAAEGCFRLLKELQSQPEEQLRSHLREFARQFIRSQPAMASIRNLAGKVRETALAMNSTDVSRVVEEFISDFESSNERISQLASGLILPRSRIMTISRSSTILRASTTAKRGGKAFSIICPESRPMNEGLTLASELSQLGIEVTICADALAPAMVSKCAGVMVGGDALVPEGLVNKSGTYPLALAAREARISFVALVPTQKFLPHFDPCWIRENDPSELLSESIENVRVCNRYFDITPLELITQIASEDGIRSPQEIREMFTK